MSKPSTEELRIVLADGKYTYIRDNEGQRALRYGEQWQDLTGNSFVWELAERIRELETAYDKLENEKWDQDNAVIKLESRLQKAIEANADPVNEVQDYWVERFNRMKAERDDYKSRWEQTGCTRHHAMETAIKLYRKATAKRDELASCYKHCCCVRNELQARIDRAPDPFGYPANTVKLEYARWYDADGPGREKE